MTVPMTTITPVMISKVGMVTKKTNTWPSRPKNMATNADKTMQRHGLFKWAPPDTDRMTPAVIVAVMAGQKRPRIYAGKAIAARVRT